MFITLTMSRAQFINKRLHGVKVVVNTNNVESFRESTRDINTTVISMASGGDLCVSESPATILALMDEPGREE